MLLCTCRDPTNYDSLGERAQNDDDFLDADINDLPLPELPAKKSKQPRGDDDSAQSVAKTSAGETFATLSPSSGTKAAGTTRKSHTRNSSLPRSFRQRNEARAGYLQRKHERMKTNSAEDLLSFERRTMNSRMHYPNYSSQLDKPRYLFGETSTLHSGLGTNSNYSAAGATGARHYFSDDKVTADFDDEIFLNKSGWVQVKQRAASHDVADNGRMSGKSRFDNNNSNSKLEDLMLRNEARKNVAMQNFYQKGYLPIVRNALGKVESPPPMTPIISPPPAFQDAAASAAAAGLSKSMRNGKQMGGGGAARVHLTVNDHHHLPHHRTGNPNAINNGNNALNSNSNNNNSSSGSSTNNPNNGNGSNKGMVFSRSFEYDNRKMNSDYSDVFSKSFEYDLSTSATSTASAPAPSIAPPSAGVGAATASSKKQQQSASLLQIQRERMPAFSNLTGNSPNYLTKKEVVPPIYRQSSLLSSQPIPKGIPSAPSITPGGTTAGLLTSRSRDTSPKMYPQQQQSIVATAVSSGRKAYSGYSSGGGGGGNGAVKMGKMQSDKYPKSFDEQVGRSRRAQFSRLRNESSNSSSSSRGFRSVDVGTVNRRLNSCDSGARSGKSDRQREIEKPPLK